MFVYACCVCSGSISKREKSSHTKTHTNNQVETDIVHLYAFDRMTSPHLCMRDILYIGFGHDGKQPKAIISCRWRASSLSRTHTNIQSEISKTKLAPSKYADTLLDSYNFSLIRWLVLSTLFLFQFI